MRVLLNFKILGLALSLLVINPLWALSLSQSKTSPSFKIRMFSPDKNEVRFYTEGMSVESVQSELDAARVPYAHEGKCDSDFDMAEAKLELTALNQRLNMAEKPIDLKPVDESLLKETPVCPEYKIEFFVLAKVMQGYELVDVLEDQIATK